MKDSLYFRRDNRIKNSRDFQFIYSKGIKISGYYYTAFFVPRVWRGETGASRLGISVPKRLGYAVQRNREKRIIREWFRVNRCQWLSAVDLVVLCRRSFREDSRKLRELEGFHLCFKNLSFFYENS